ncbi:hypothetical protein NW752_005446 [Fusarium irregulare]|nr:hypothetical protein NW752_005446 [Fusarium irregulare]
MMAHMSTLVAEEEQQFWTRNTKHAVKLARRRADPSEENRQFSTVEKAEQFLSSPYWDKVGKTLKMMLEESGVGTDDEGLDEESSDDEGGGGGGDGRGSATKSRGRQNRGAQKRKADTAGITTPENGDERVATGTGAVPNGAFNHLNNKRKAKKPCIG